MFDNTPLNFLRFEIFSEIYNRIVFFWDILGRFCFTDHNKNPEFSIQTKKIRYFSVLYLLPKLGYKTNYLRFALIVAYFL